MDGEGGLGIVVAILGSRGGKRMLSRCMNG